MEFRLFVELLLAGFVLRIWSFILSALAERFPQNGWRQILNGYFRGAATLRLQRTP